jgi:hypothetical protein
MAALLAWHRTVRRRRMRWALAVAAVLAGALAVVVPGGRHTRAALAALAVTARAVALPGDLHKALIGPLLCGALRTRGDLPGLLTEGLRVWRIPFGGRHFVRKEDMHEHLGDFVNN